MRKKGPCTSHQVTPGHRWQPSLNWPGAGFAGKPSQVARSWFHLRQGLCLTASCNSFGLAPGLGVQQSSEGWAGRRICAWFGVRSFPFQGFSRWLRGRESSCNVGDPCGSEDPLEKNLLQHGKSHGQGKPGLLHSCGRYSHTQLSDLTTTSLSSSLSTSQIGGALLLGCSQGCLAIPVEHNQENSLSKRLRVDLVSG